MCDVLVVCVCLYACVCGVCMCARVEKGQDECQANAHYLAVLQSIYVISFIRTPMVATG